jgi:hypothetical protein
MSQIQPKNNEISGPTDEELVLLERYVVAPQLVRALVSLWDTQQSQRHVILSHEMLTVGTLVDRFAVVLMASNKWAEENKDKEVESPVFDSYLTLRDTNFITKLIDAQQNGRKGAFMTQELSFVGSFYEKLSEYNNRTVNELVSLRAKLSDAVKDRTNDPVDQMQEAQTELLSRSRAFYRTISEVQAYMKNRQAQHDDEKKNLCNVLSGLTNEFDHMVSSKLLCNSLEAASNPSSPEEVKLETLNPSSPEEVKLEALD